MLGRQGITPRDLNDRLVVPKEPQEQVTTVDHKDMKRTCVDHGLMGGSRSVMENVSFSTMSSVLLFIHTTA